MAHAPASLLSQPAIKGKRPFGEELTRARLDPPPLPLPPSLLLLIRDLFPLLLLSFRGSRGRVEKRRRRRLRHSNKKHKGREEGGEKVTPKSVCFGGVSLSLAACLFLLSCWRRRRRRAWLNVRQQGREGIWKQSMQCVLSLSLSFCAAKQERPGGRTPMLANSPSPAGGTNLAIV